MSYGQREHETMHRVRYFGENEETIVCTNRVRCSLSVRSDSIPSSIGVNDLECVGVEVPPERGSNNFLIIRFFNEIFGGRDSDSDPEPVVFRKKPVFGFSGLVTFQLLSST